MGDEVVDAAALGRGTGGDAHGLGDAYDRLILWVDYH